jgi:hypothetical protein
LTQLSAARSTIKAGDVTAEDFFAPKKPVDDSKGNDAVKSKLKKKNAAKAAGADPETGELPATTKPPETQAASSPDKVKQTPAEQPKEHVDLHDQLATNFSARCGEKKTISDLALLKHENRDFLAEVMQTNPPKYNHCADSYNMQMVKLDGTAAQMMPRA